MIPRRRPDRGSGMIEVLIAITIMSLLIAGVLQIFSLSLLQNYGSAARTQLTYKAQQVVETIRISQYWGKQGQTTMATASNIGYPLVASATPNPLPYDLTETGSAFWGPTGLNVIEKANDAYRLFYTVQAAGTIFNVTVTAYPADSGESPLPVANPSGGKYFGMQSRFKRVEYVAQIPSS